MNAQLHGHALRLILCSAILLAVGGAMWLRKGDDRAKGFGVMLSIWSLIDIAIGAGSLVGAAPTDLQELIRFLWINIGLDAVYVAVGFGMSMRSQKPFTKGMGAAVQIQGALLGVLDLYLVSRL